MAPPLHKTISELKAIFITDAIPTQQNFADLFDTLENIVKSVGDGFQLDNGALNHKLQPNSGLAVTTSGITVDSDVLRAHAMNVSNQVTGLIDGVNVEFAMLHAPEIGTDLVFKDGHLLDYATEYSFTDNVLTFAVAPAIGSKLRIFYVSAA
jgi:hypothetical protein